MNQRSLRAPKMHMLDDNCGGGLINIPWVFDCVMTPSIDGIINHGICADQHEDEALIVQSSALYAAALFVAISMMIFAFGKAFHQSTNVNQRGWKILIPFSITLLSFIFFAFLTIHGCVFFGKTANLLASRGEVSHLQNILMKFMIVLVVLFLTLCSILFIYPMVGGIHVAEALSQTVVLLVASITLAIEIVTNTLVKHGTVANRGYVHSGRWLSSLWLTAAIRNPFL